jgi:hypothetical protein
VIYLGVEFPEKEILMAYVTSFLILKIPKNPKKLINHPQKGILMVYVSRSCDF